MTDRFYQVGLPASRDAWKTTYELANEMRSFARSAYPPGAAVHLPGARSKFGYSNPGPDHAVLAQGDLFPTEEVDVQNPRESHALPRVQVPDDRLNFMSLDAGAMGMSYKSPVATAVFSPGSMAMKKTRSLPSLTKVPPKAQASFAPAPAHSLEDEHFQYFVPMGLASGGKVSLNPHHLSKLEKSSMISFPFSGEGTGFRTQSGRTNLFPEGTYENLTTTSRTQFKRPGVVRNAPPGC